MAYALTGDIVAYCGRGEKLLSPSSPLSVEDLESILEGVALEIDLTLAALGVKLPVTSGDSPRAFAFLRTLNAIGAAAAVELRLFGEATPGARGTTRHEILTENYRDFLRRLRSKEIFLTDLSGGPIPDADIAFSGSQEAWPGATKRPLFARGMRF